MQASGERSQETQATVEAPASAGVVEHIAPIPEGLKAALDAEWKQAMICCGRESHLTTYESVGSPPAIATKDHE